MLIFVHLFSIWKKMNVFLKMKMKHYNESKWRENKYDYLLFHTLHNLDIEEASTFIFTLTILC